MTDNTTLVLRQLQTTNYHIVKHTNGRRLLLFVIANLCCYILFKCQQHKP